MTTIKPTRTLPTPERIRAMHAASADAETDARKPTLPAVAATGDKAPPSVPALASTDDYFNRNPGRMCLGRPVRPNLKLGRWIFADDSADTPLPETAIYAVLTPMTWVGLVRLEAGQPPQYDGGFLFQGDFKRASRDAVGDLDPAGWPLSQFDGQPQDPWLEAVYQPLEQQPSGELVTIQIQAKPRSAAIFAIDGLLAHCRQLQRRDPNSFPLIKLAIGSYESTKYGTQFKPVFQIVGKTPKAGVAKADGSLAADMDDFIDF